MDLDTIAITYLLHRTNPPLAEISTLEMDRTQSVGEFLALAASFSSKYLKDVGEMRVYKPRIPVTTFQQFTTLVQSLPPNLSSIAYPLQNSSSIEKDLPEFHHYVIISVSPQLSASSSNHLPSPPPSPLLKQKNLYNAETPMATVLAHPLFDELADLPCGKVLPISLVSGAVGGFVDFVEGRAGEVGASNEGADESASTSADERRDRERNDVGEEEALFTASLSSTLRSQGQKSSESKFAAVRNALAEWLGTTFEISCRASDSYFSSSQIILTHSPSPSSPSPSPSALSHAHLALNTLLRTSPPSPTPRAALHIHLSGPFLEISGIAWTSFSVLYEPLCAVPLGYGVGLARVLRTLRAFTRIMKEEEEREGEGRGLEIPYALVDGTLEKFGIRVDKERVERPFAGRLLFFAPSLPSSSSPTSSSSSTQGELAIKFTRTYSPQTHTFLSSRGHAPELFLAKRLPGGWWIVVMRRLGVRRGWVPMSLLMSSSSGEGEDSASGENSTDNEEDKEKVEGKGKMETTWWKSLETHILRAITKMHDAGYVHGDLRPENIFVRARGGGVSPSPSPSLPSPSSSPSPSPLPPNAAPAEDSKTEFAILDFDWSGPLGSTRYPWDVNSLRVQRPPSVCAGGLVGREDDLWMVRRGFRGV